jgi:hypothetical protein
MRKEELGEKLKQLTDKPTKATGSWSKYGGGEYGIDKQQTETWYCQACGEEQPKELHGFMLGTEQAGFVRVCATCFSKARTLEYSYTKTIYIVRLANHRD